MAASASPVPPASARSAGLEAPAARVGAPAGGVRSTARVPGGLGGAEARVFAATAPRRRAVDQGATPTAAVAPTETTRTETARTEALRTQTARSGSGRWGAARSTTTASSVHDAAVDPRMVARRDEVARQEQWRRARPLVALLSFVIVVVIGIGVLLSPLLSVRSIVVVGAAGGDERGVVAASGVQLGTPLVRVVPAQVERRIEALSWVRSASVRRDWPRTIEVRVVLRSLLAAVPLGSSGSFAVVDRDGWVLRTVTSRAAVGDIPLLPADAVIANTGPDGSAAIDHGRVQLRPSARPLLAVLQSLDPAVRRRVESIAADGPTFVVTIDGFEGGARLEARLGTPTDLAFKAAALRSLLDREELRSGGSVDLSVADAPVVLPTGSPTVGTAAATTGSVASVPAATATTGAR